MENTAVKNIPYPSEFEDPFFESFENMMEYMDSNMDVQYAPIAGASALGGDIFSYAVSTEMDRLIKPGVPIRHRLNPGDPWRYAIISVTGAGQAWFDGAFALGPGGEFQAGSPTMVITKHLFFPGQYQQWGSENALFWENKNEAFIWDGPEAYCVRMAVINKTNKSSGTENANVVIRPGGPSGPPPGSYAFTDNGGDGPWVRDLSPTFSTQANTNSYGIQKGDNYDMYVRGLPPGDGEDLSATLTFVIKGDEEVDCPGNFPATILTISGMPGGEDWQGLGDGVHTLCPSLYEYRNDIYTASSFYFSERWYDQHSPGYTNDRLEMRARRRDDEGPLFEFSAVYMAFGTATGVYYSTRSWSSGVQGQIRNRLFRVFVLGGVTFTTSRGPGPWLYQTPTGP